MATKQCLCCGNSFRAIRRTCKYCSDDCRKQVKYEKDRAWLKAHPGKAADYSRRWYAANKEQALKDKKETYFKKCMLEFGIDDSS